MLCGSSNFHAFKIFRENTKMRRLSRTNILVGFEMRASAQRLSDGAVQNEDAHIPHTTQHTLFCSLPSIDNMPIIIVYNKSYMRQVRPMSEDTRRSRSCSNDMRKPFVTSTNSCPASVRFSPDGTTWPPSTRRTCVAPVIKSSVSFCLKLTKPCVQWKTHSRKKSIKGRWQCLRGAMMVTNKVRYRRFVCKNDVKR